MYKKRYLEDLALKLHRTFKVLYVGGPRQVGKTTLLLHLAKSIRMNYVSMDDISARRLAKEDPQLFLETFPAPLLIDEVQYAPELFSFIKLHVDRTRKTGQYWLTGSQQFAIIKNLKESLAGRVGIIHLLGFSQAEEEGWRKHKEPFLPERKNLDSHALNIRAVFHRIWRGSFPALAARNAPDVEIFYNSYLQTYIDRDLRDIFQVSKISTFHRFLELCAARTGQILHFSDLARDAGISVHAAREWINILEASMQIYLLRPYFRNISKRLIKSPKLYFLDTGLAAFLTKWKTPETLMKGAMAGAFFETYAVSEIIKSYLFRGEEPPLYYFRDKEGHEVDILIERNGILYPIEVKLKGSVSHSDFKNINYLRNKIGIETIGTILNPGPSSLPISRENRVISLSAIS